MALADSPSGYSYGNSYLTGSFAPVHDEVFAAELSVIGQLPETLHGVPLEDGKARCSRDSRRAGSESCSSNRVPYGFHAESDDDRCFSA